MESKKSKLTHNIAREPEEQMSKVYMGPGSGKDVDSMKGKDGDSTLMPRSDMKKPTGGKNPVF